MPKFVQYGGDIDEGETLTLKAPSITGRLGNVFGSTKKAGTKYTGGSPADLIALVQPSLRLEPKVHCSPAKVDTRDLPRYMRWLGWVW